MAKHFLPKGLNEQANDNPQQSFTRFLTLPRELRDQIYASHFRSLTLTYPTFTPSPLVFASHQIHTEALRFLRPNAIYNLLTSEHFIDYLTTLTPASLAQVRHISVCGYPLPVYPDDDDSCYTTHSFPSLLPLFPGLQLDTMEVIDAYHGKDVVEDGWGHNATYGDLEDMIKNGQGWKELIFRSASDRWMKPVTFSEIGTLNGQKTTGRSAQPGAWDTMIKERDGKESGARVEIWTSKEEGVWGKVEGEYKPDLEEEGDDDSEVEDEAGDDESPSIEVRVRRGKGAEYVQGKRPVNDHELSHKFHEMFERLGWKEIKARRLFISGAEDDPCAHL